MEKHFWYFVLNILRHVLFFLFLQYIIYAFERTRKTSISLEVSLYISNIHLIDLFIGSCHCCQRREKKLNCISTQTTISVYIL